MIFKLDNITSLTTARWAAAEGFSYISFNFDKSDPNYIQPMEVVEICKWVTGLKIVGKFPFVETFIIKDLYELLKLDNIEIDLMTAETLLLNHPIPTILNVDENSWEHALEFRKHNSCVFAFAVQSNTVKEINFPSDECFIPSDSLHTPGRKLPYGINFNSANETEPGIVDFEELSSRKEMWEFCKQNLLIL